MLDKFLITVLMMILYLSIGLTVWALGRAAQWLFG